MAAGQGLKIRVREGTRDCVQVDDVPDHEAVMPGARLQAYSVLERQGQPADRPGSPGSRGEQLPLPRPACVRPQQLPQQGPHDDQRSRCKNRSRSSRWASARSRAYSARRWLLSSTSYTRRPDQATCSGSSTFPAAGPFRSSREHGRRRAYSLQRGGKLPVSTSSLPIIPVPTSPGPRHAAHCRYPHLGTRAGQRQPARVPERLRAVPKVARFACRRHVPVPVAVPEPPGETRRPVVREPVREPRHAAADHVQVALACGHAQPGQGEPRPVNVREMQGSGANTSGPCAGAGTSRRARTLAHGAGICAAGGTVMPCPAAPSRRHSAASWPATGLPGVSNGTISVGDRLLPDLRPNGHTATLKLPARLLRSLSVPRGRIFCRGRSEGGLLRG